MEVYIVYRALRSDSKSMELWSVYDNEIEALRECNHWNSEKGVYCFYTLPKQVYKVFGV